MPRHQIIEAIRQALSLIAEASVIWDDGAQSAAYPYETALDLLTDTARTLEAEEQAQDEWATREEAASQAWFAHGHGLCRDLNSYPEAIEACPF